MQIAATGAIETELAKSGPPGTIIHAGGGRKLGPMTDQVNEKAKETIERAKPVTPQVAAREPRKRRAASRPLAERHRGGRWW
jgi:hypothetical protein